MALTFYAPTFLDESRTYPDKNGNSRNTGIMRGMIFTRTFKRRGSKIVAERGLIPFSWKEDTQEAKVEALAKAIEGMEEMAELDDNPNIGWIPKTIKERLS